MNRLIYSPESRKVDLIKLNSTKTVDSQRSKENVQDFILRICDRIERKFKLNFEDNITLGKQMLEDNIYRGVVLEGIPATYAQTIEIINNLPVTSSLNPGQINEIVSLKRAWEFILNKENLLSDMDAIYLDSVKEIHAIIGANMESLNPLQVGELRETPIYVGGVKNHNFGIPKQADIEYELSELSKISDPVVQALELFCYLCKKQMFRDGNKRTANLVANFVLIQSGSGLLSIREDLVPDFKILLIDWYENDNKKDLMNFLLNKCYLYNFVGKAFLD